MGVFIAGVFFKGLYWPDFRVFGVSLSGREAPGGYRVCPLLGFLAPRGSPPQVLQGLSPVSGLYPMPGLVEVSLVYWPLFPTFQVEPAFLRPYYWDFEGNYYGQCLPI